ncbi:hypothetical protein SCHPADRAFT_993380 [Schizopora paradoxa]|uniref:Uncharacterized protein n=1 Tax=Schizopora paradoxa TaxID=27342 RepID=A0A0H2S3T1_9AGAM|nr:hypothetical protein SCHPADRAFT_993380 [Schizopora paradoxa]
MPQIMHRLAVALLLFKGVLCTLRNVSIDDTMGDPVTRRNIIYNPPGDWAHGQSCRSCSAQATQPEDAFDGTWHNSTYQVGGSLVSASAQFNGTAVYVICILTGSLQRPNGNSDMTFILDGKTVGNFALAPDGDDEYKSNVTVYANESLSSGVHNITLVSGLAGQESLVLLDRIIYSMDDGDGVPEPSASAQISLDNISSSGSSTSSALKSSPTDSKSSSDSTGVANATSASQPTNSDSAASSSASSSTSPSATSSGWRNEVGTIAGILAISLILLV